MHFIYEIYNTRSEKIYVGKTSGFDARIQVHKSLLNRQRHDNYQLQLDWNKYGTGSFLFRPIACAISESHLASLEDYFIEVKNSSSNKSGYNKSNNRQWSKEARVRDSERKLCRSGKYRFIPGISLRDPVSDVLLDKFFFT